MDEHELSQGYFKLTSLGPFIYIVMNLEMWSVLYNSTRVRLVPGTVRLNELERTHANFLLDKLRHFIRDLHFDMLIFNI